MLKNVLIGFALATLAILLLLWLATGGLRKVSETARGITTPFSSGFWSGLVGAEFKLPWQPEPVRGPDILLDEAGSTEEGARDPEEELADAQKEYDELVQKMEDARTFGEPSSFRGKVHLAQGDTTASSPNAEYVTIEAAWGNTTPLEVSGWSVQSALTGVRGYFPRGASVFLMGAVNSQNNISLAPGASAVVTTGYSPVGTSFQENMCTGYLGGLQTFVPSLSRNCPAPSDSIPLTAESLQVYGDACYDFVQTLPPCTFPRSAPPNVSPACNIFLANNLSYNGCVLNYRDKTGFARDSWRIYLNAGGELWRNSHDIIRLLDAEGRTVDMISY